MIIRNAQLDWRDGLPYSREFEDVYFSRDDAEGESRHVFLQGNNLADRWSQLPADARFCLAELGFGSGLNFMQSVILWRSVAPASARLHYLAFEKHPLTLADLERVHACWPDCSEPGTALRRIYPEHTAGCHRLIFGPNIILDLHYGDALEALTACERRTVDCWFLDGFSPSHNPALWQQALFGQMAERSAAHTTLSTYSVAGVVRQGLREAGFIVSKQPGFGRKREMLSASGPPDPFTTRAMADSSSPWSNYPPVSRSRGRALVIGAGLAGCSTAWSLAQRGWQVTVLEREQQPAAAASGISQLALRCRLFRESSPVTDFYTHAYLYASRLFRQWQQSCAFPWHGTGVLQSRDALNRSQPLTDAELDTLYDSRLLHTVEQSRADSLAGMPLAISGWFLPEGGWVNPATLCAACLAQPAINLRSNSHVQELQHSAESGWQVSVSGPEAETLAAEVVVIANSAAATRFTQSRYLPLQQVRGQTTNVTATAQSQTLATVVCGERTVFPATAIDSAGGLAHTVAASYGADCTQLQANPEEDRTNLQLAAANFREPTQFGTVARGSQVACRSNTPDRLPIVGRLADAHAATGILAALARNARHRFAASEVNPAALYYDGLYVNVAHGSNGLATCPFSAEILASLISGEIPPCPAAVLHALNPIRFLVRDLKKQREKRREKPRKKLSEI